jgi:hypothetical protein
VALTKSVSRALQRQIDLTTAVCQERLLAAHVRHMLAMVDLVADRIAFDDALEIYVRILRLTPEQARNVGSRALAELGRRTARGEGERPVPLIPEEEGEEEAEAPREGGRADLLFGRLRRRIRGRVQEDLRHRISLAAARTEDALLEAHVENALIFVKALDDELQAPDAVELYVETMMLPEGLGDVIYNRALRILADELLPAMSAREPASTESTPEAPRSISV